MQQDLISSKQENHKERRKGRDEAATLLIDGEDARKLSTHLGLQHERKSMEGERSFAIISYASS